MHRKGDIVNNRYTILDVMSTGKSSAIYLVRDPLLGKDWVMKEFFVTIENPRQLEYASRAFEKEVTILAGLKYGGTPEIIDYFSGRSSQYIVMENVKGINLEEMIANSREPMYEPDAVRLGIRLAEILEYLHSRKPPIFFRDLRPRHIMITSDNQVKVIDFNLAHHFISIKDIRRRKTGIPGYAPPEQISQNIIDERGDVYALGAVLHQLVTLRNPAALTNAFKFPEASSINPQVSSMLDKIIAKATSYSSPDRYSTISEMKAELQELLERRSPSSTAREVKKKEQKPPPKPPKPPKPPVKPAGNDEPEKKAGTAAPKKEYFQTPPELRDLDDEPSKQGMPVKKIAITVSLVLLAVFAGLFLFFVFRNRMGKKRYNVKSPFALPTDKRILDYRERGIAAYKKGMESMSKSDFAEAADLLEKVVSAHPTDAVSQVYYENCHALLKGDKVVRTAVILSISGEDFESGVQMLAGVALVQGLHNKNGNVRSIVVEVYDDKSENKTAIEIAAELSKRNDIMAVVGPIRTPFLKSTSIHLNSGGIVQIAPTAVASDVDNLGEYIFRNLGDGRDQGIYLAKMALGKVKAKKIAVLFDPAQGYSHSLATIFEETVKEKGGAEVKMFKTALEGGDYQKAADDIKAWNPDTIFFVGYQKHVADFARILQKKGMKETLIAPQAAYSVQLINEGGRAVEGTILDTYFFPDFPMKSTQLFVKLYREKYDVEPNFRAALAYDAMLVVSRAIDKDKYTSESLMKYMKKNLGITEVVEGATGQLSYDKFGKRKKVNIIPITVKNGEFVRYKK